MVLPFVNLEGLIARSWQRIDNGGYGFSCSQPFVILCHLWKISARPSRWL